MTPIVGIDIGKRACHVCIKHHPTSEPIQFTVPHGETATRILELLPGDPPAIIAMERTRNLSNPILAALENTPHLLTIAQHTDTLALRTLLRTRRKTDKLDAELICRMAGLMTTPETAPLIAAYLTTWESIRACTKAREDVRFYQSMVRSATALKNRLKATQSAIHRAYLSEQLKLLETHSAAHVAAITAELPPEAALLTTIPTITPRRAIVLFAAIGDIRNFPSRDHLVSYLGLKPPRRSQTGGKDFGRPKITKGLDLLHSELHMIGLQVAARPMNADRLGETYLRMKQRRNGRIALWAVRR